MPRPETKEVTITVDGREITTVEGTMLVDAAKAGDVEIPYFCYEPKLGAPVGACRMCLVEIEGLPKLQTSCSTPVRDGMVVHTQNDRVESAQNAIVEFLLVNHPLDCPVCDKGGECPLQDISYGWGGGISRFVDPKRHFVKPLALSPLIAIDRERCILCYRCVRFSQEIAEDWQLIFTERGAHTFVGTHDGHPYVAPFSGNIVELCPVGALTSRPYRFRARPWDIEGAAGVCTLCPAQCNVEFTVRDDTVMRVLARQNDGVDDGWLCDKGRFAYQSIHADERITRPLVRDGGVLREVSWDRAFEAAAAITRHRGRIGALAGGGASGEEGFLLQRLLREGLDSYDLDCRAGEPVPTGLARALAAPALQASVPDVEFAHTVLLVGTEPVDEMPILDLRIRKGIRRHGVKLVVASARPSSLDAGARHAARIPVGGEAEFLHAVGGALSGRTNGSTPDDIATVAQILRDGGDDVVIVYGEGLPAAALAELHALATALGLSGREGAGLLEVPAAANGRGLREAGMLPDAGPGLADVPAVGRGAGAIAEAAIAGELTALYLLDTDPIRDRSDRALWERALAKAPLVVAHAAVMTAGLRDHATVIFPAESWAEKEGTVVHPDGRLQRLRAAIGHPGDVRAGWSVLSELARRCGADLGVLTAGMAFAQLVAAVPFYGGITLEEIGGQGVRWPVREAALAFPTGSVPAGLTGATVERADLSPAPARGGAAADAAADAAGGTLVLGRYRSIWAAPEVEISPALKFLAARQQVELAPEDARRIGVSHGERVVVSANGTRVEGTVAVRSGVPVGTAFLAEGLPNGDSANGLTQATVEIAPAVTAVPR